MCVFLLQIATTRFARKCKGKVLQKRNFGVEENKQVINGTSAKKKINVSGNILPLYVDLHFVGYM